MSSAVKCPACSSFYNGAVYAKCPYCGSGNAEKRPEVPAEEVKEKKKAGIKLPSFITGKKKTENKPEGEIKENNNPPKVEDPGATLPLSYFNEKAGEEAFDPVPFKTVPKDVDHVVDVDISKKAYDEQPKSATSSGTSLSNALSRSGKTVGKYISSSTGESIAPVVGWIIGVKGADYGRSYNLKSGKNRIGRSLEMDVALEEESVSRASVAVIIFDSKQKEFSILSGESDSLCFLNGSAVYERQVLSIGDEIEFGDSELNKYVFIPLCGNGFNWDKYPIK